MEILNNPIVKNIALKSLKKSFEESGTKAILITRNEKTGEFDFQQYKTDIVILSQSDFNDLLKQATQ